MTPKEVVREWGGRFNAADAQAQAARIFEGTERKHRGAEVMAD